MEGKTEEDSRKVILIMNNVLCYASTARHRLRADDIIRTCLMFYDDDEIIKGKDVLFNLVSERSIRRRNENRIMHELKDILDMFKKCDESKVSLPLFVADSYNGMPPSSGFEIIAQSMQTLIQEIANLKKEIEVLKEVRLAEDLRRKDKIIMQEDLLIIKGELRKMNHKLVGEEMRRNSLTLDSLEVNLQNFRKVTDCIVSRPTEEKEIASVCMSQDCHDISQDEASAPPASQEEWHKLNSLLCDDGGPPSAPSFADVVISGTASDRIDATEPESNRALIAEGVIEAVEVKDRTPKKPATYNRISLHPRTVQSSDDDDGSGKGDFTIVQNKRHRKNVIGSKAPSSNSTLKSAVRTGDLYLGNCDPSVTVESLTKYIWKSNLH